MQEFDAIQKDTEALRSQDNELSQKMKESTGTYDFPEAVKQISKNFDKADGDPFAVENVVGATISSNDFKQLAGSILAMSAVEGDTGDSLISISKYDALRNFFDSSAAYFFKRAARKSFTNKVHGVMILLMAGNEKRPFE